MKIQIAKAIKQGLKVIIGNPAIATMVILNGILHCICIYFFLYAPALAMAPAPELLANFWLYTILANIISLFIYCVICKMVYDAVKGKVSFSEAISLSLRKFIFILVGAFMLYSLIIVPIVLYFLIIPIPVHFAVFIIPGIFLLIKFYFYSYAILLDNEGMIDSFEKSWQITKGNWWRTFGLYLIFFIPIMILFYIASIYIAIISVPIALVIDFIALLLAGWLISSFTIAYIQLTTNPEQQNLKQQNKEVVREGV